MMGDSIATRVSQAGLSVVICEISPERVTEVKQALARSLARDVERWSLTDAERRTILSRISFTHDLEEACRECDLVVETIYEDAEAKRTLLRELDSILHSDIPIFINTSTLSITDLARGMAHPERVLGMHFLYPVTTTRVVEVVRAQETSDTAFEVGRRFARILGKVPIEGFESPGFVTTRVLMPLINEAIHVTMEGVASAAEVDLAMKLGYNFKFGPLEWADQVGLDRVYKWLQHLFEETGEAKFRPCPLLRRLVRAGHTGARVGKGFFTYDERLNRLDRLPEDSPRFT